PIPRGRNPFPDRLEVGGSSCRSELVWLCSPRWPSALAPGLAAAAEVAVTRPIPVEPAAMRRAETAGTQAAPALVVRVPAEARPEDRAAAPVDPVTPADREATPAAQAVTLAVPEGAPGVPGAAPADLVPTVERVREEADP